MENAEGVSIEGRHDAPGAYPCVISPGSLALALYRRSRISERHRHRYEVNNAYRKALEEAGFKSPPALSPDDQLVEIMELPGHPWFLGCQFHPELRSRPLGLPSAVPRAHPRGGRSGARRLRPSARPKVRALKAVS